MKINVHRSIIRMDRILQNKMQPMRKAVRCKGQIKNAYFVKYDNELGGSFFNCIFTLRKHTYSNILKIPPPKTKSFQRKNSDIFHISAQNMDCGYSLEPPRRGGSNEYPQSMFKAEMFKAEIKVMYTSVNSSFTL